MPAVTTIIPAYNAAPYIEQTVTSALNQRAVDNEVIVIDDGSADATWDVVQKFQGTIRAIRQDNAGPCVTRNRAAALAKGEWLAFLDADDEWLPDKLARQLALADEGTALVYTDRLNFGDIGRVAERQSDSVRLWAGDVFEPLLFDNFITTSSVIIRRSWFERLGGFEQSLLPSEDWDLWLRLAGEGGQVKLCSDPLTRYRWHTTSITHDHRRMAAARLRVIRRALTSQRSRRLNWRTARLAVSNVLACSAWYASATKPWIAAAWYLEAASQWPFNLELYKGMLKCLLRRA